MSRRIGLTYEVKQRLNDLYAFGESKHDLKRSGEANDFIFSFGTCKTYLRECVAFVKWCRKEHGTRDIEACKKYVKQYISNVRKQDGSKYSAYSLATKASAIAKMYGTQKVKTPTRRREDIKRSRRPVERDKHYSPEKHKDLEAFGNCTGLRRHEMATLRGSQLEQKDGKYYIHVIGNQAKGGKERYVEIVGDISKIVQCMKSAGNDFVFKKIPSAFDEHSHRAIYAATIYKQYARDYDTCKRSPFATVDKTYKDSIYRCRHEMSGKWFDREAMLIASKSLGHNRIDVIAQSYLYLL